MENGLACSIKRIEAPAVPTCVLLVFSLDKMEVHHCYDPDSALPRGYKENVIGDLSVS